MKEYRRRADLVKAVQYTGQNIDEVRGLVAGHFLAGGRYTVDSESRLVIQFETKEAGTVATIHPSYWVVVEAGKLAVLPRGNFEEMYELVYLGENDD